MEQMSNKIYDMILLCGFMVWNRKPSMAYMERVVKLLWMTAAHESDRFRARRQYGFRDAPYSIHGAFGLMQTERISIRSSVAYVNRNPTLLQNIHDYLSNYYSQVYFPTSTLDLEIMPILELVQTPEGDPYSIMLGRVHYLQRRPLVPDSIQGMGAYAKQHYNTELGKATPAQYVSAYKATWPFTQ